MTRLLAAAVCVSASLFVFSAAAHAADKSEPFDRDPGWDAFNNRVVPDRVPTVTQDFGYSAATNFAGKTKGEMGGLVTRATNPAYYGAVIQPKTLNDKLSASGSFAFTKTDGGGGAFFGWFNASQQPGNGRPVSSLGLNIDTEKTGCRLAIRLITGENKTCGTFVTPFVPGGYRPTPIRNDGTRYHFKLDYDPAGASGNGQFTFTLTSNSATPEEFEGKPFTVDLTPGFKNQNTTFDRFGLMNGTKSGGTLEMYYDDLTIDGTTVDFAADPGWAGSGNQETYEDKRQVGAHDFGFSSDTHYAGGAKPGEMGGDLWRSGKFAYYADRVGPLTLDHKLEASGKVVLQVGAPDSDVYLGWFASEGRDDPKKEAGNFVGVHIGGPTRVGHYFSPILQTAAGGIAKLDKAPILAPGTALDWTITYDPAGNDGDGELRVTLGSESITLPIKKGLKAQGGTFDRFGLWNSTAGGQLVRIFLDDVRYTSR